MVSITQSKKLPPRLAAVVVVWVISLHGAGAASDFAQYRSSGFTPEFGVDYPKWQPKKSGSPFNVLSLTRSDNQCYFDLDASDAPLDHYQAFVQKYFKEQGATIVSPNPLSYEFKTKDGKYTFVARTRGIDCGKKSYLATVTCVRESFDQQATDRVFGSMQCGGSAFAPAPSAAAPKPAAVPPAPPPPGGANAVVGKGSGLQLRLERLKPGVSFRAIVTVNNTDKPAGEALPAITSSRGRVSAVTRNPDGSFAAVVEPDDAGTGEYRVTATLGNLSTSKTAVVLKAVGERWGQPQAVEGLVNTPGWEDSVYITPDGEWLFLSYSPVSITCTWKHDHARYADFCGRALGPWSGPARPGFIGAERISKSGEVSNRCLGVKPSFVIPPFATYGFRRQADGSFAEPFVIGVANSGGCIIPGGINVYPRPDRSAHILYLWNEYWRAGNPGNTYSVAEIPRLGTDFNLGTWQGTYGSGGSVTGYVGTALQIPDAQDRLGHNVHGHMDAAGQIRQLFFDNENGARDVYAVTLAPNGKYPSGPWSAPVTIPKPVSSGQETMPFFDGRRLTVRRGNGIATVEFTPGSDLANARAWSAYTPDLTPDESAWHTTGAIYTLGEPTRTDPALTTDGKEVLYFNYAVREADGSTNLNVGFVSAGN